MNAQIAVKAVAGLTVLAMGTHNFVQKKRSAKRVQRINDTLQAPAVFNITTLP